MTAGLGAGANEGSGNRYFCAILGLASFSGMSKAVMVSSRKFNSCEV